MTLLYKPNDMYPFLIFRNRQWNRISANILPQTIANMGWVDISVTERRADVDSG